MKSSKSNSSILFCLLETAAGILLLIKPIGFTSIIIILAGVVLLINGLLNIVKYFRTPPEQAAASQFLMKGLVSLTAGMFCIFRSQWLLVTFPLLTVLYGTAILLAGLGKVQLTADMLRLKNKNWYWSAVNAAISIICSLIILNNPFSSTAALWTFTGISFIIEAVFDVITILKTRKK